MTVIQLAVLEIPPSQEHSGTVIFLHGLGQHAQQWEPIVRTLAAYLPGVKWVLPQSPLLPITMNEGQLRPAWFDVFHLPPCRSCGLWGICTSVASVEQLIHREMQNVDRPSKVVLAGFSQGASLSMVLALTSLHDLGGVASLSGWIPHRKRQGMSHIEPCLPVFWGHGAEDTEIPEDMGEECIRFLKEGLNFSDDKITLKAYDGLGHAVSDQEVEDLAIWLRSTLL